MTIGKPVILIPAFNEQLNIARAIQLIRKTGVDAHIIVINDGSTDKTAKIAVEEMGCEVINSAPPMRDGSPKNVGKANAFFAGVRRAIRLNASATVVIDADIIKLTGAGLKEMISKAEKATLEKKPLMVIAPAIETHDKVYDLNVDSSGERAFSNMGLWLIEKSRTKGKIKGFGLEKFLKGLFYFHGTADVINHEEPPFYTGRAFRTSNAVQQNEASVRATRAMQKMRQHGKRL